MEAADGLPESAGEFFSLTARQFLSGADGENRIYSPANLYMALAMLAQSTDGAARGRAPIWAACLRMARFLPGGAAAFSFAGILRR